MKSDDIRDQVSRNMHRRGFAIADLRLQPDPFNGWRLWLESEGFRGMPRQDRRAMALEGLADEHFEWLDLITSEEKAWAGVAPRDSDLEDLPLWPEALARARTLTEPIDACFMSDLDEDLPPPLVCTFYSLKGGVGLGCSICGPSRRILSRGSCAPSGWRGHGLGSSNNHFTA
jgi:hypothetical protein